MIALPWRAGSVPQARDTTWMTVTRFVFAGYGPALRAAPAALRFWLSWADVPGSAGLAVRFDLRARAAWTLSGWSDPGDLQAFLRSDAHQRVVAAFAHALDGTSRGWRHTGAIDVGACWRAGAERLEAAPTP